MSAFCTSCGRPTGPERFCVGCGTPLRPVEEPMAETVFSPAPALPETVTMPPVAAAPPAYVPAAAIGGLPPVAMPLVDPTRKAAKKTPWVAIAAVILVLAGAGGAGAYVLLHKDSASTTTVASPTTTPRATITATSAPVASSTPRLVTSVTCWNGQVSASAASCPPIHPGTEAQKTAVLHNAFPALAGAEHCVSSAQPGRYLFVECSAIVDGGSVCLHASWWSSPAGALGDYRQLGTSQSITGGQFWPARLSSPCQGHTMKAAVLSSDDAFGLTAYADSGSTASTAAKMYGYLAPVSARAGH